MLNPVNKLVGLRLRQRRRHLLIRQKDLAEKIGVTTQQVQKYEKGINAISISRLVDCMVILKVDANYFVSEDDNF